MSYFEALNSRRKSSTVAALRVTTSMESRERELLARHHRSPEGSPEAAAINPAAGETLPEGSDGRRREDHVADLPEPDEQKPRDILGGEG